MKIAHIQFSRSIRWRLNLDTPKTLSVSPNLGWALVSPLLYNLLPENSTSRLNFMHYAPTMVWVNSSSLVLIRENSVLGMHNENDAEQVRAAIGALLKKLRYLSGQADMPKLEDFLVMTFGEIGTLPEFVPTEYHHSAATIQTYPLAVAITRANVEAAATLPDDFSPPVHSVLLLDAISAFLASEHRISILFSAMAMEVGFGTALDGAYDAALTEPDNIRYRVQKIPIGNGRFTLKDPIYDRLRERDSFSIQMHEMALYMLGRSLREDNNALYLDALVLYRSRNKIVHSGTTEDAQEEVLPIEEKGAKKALHISADCLTWLGLYPGFKLPKLQFLTGDDFNRFAQSLDT